MYSLPRSTMRRNSSGVVFDCGRDRDRSIEICRGFFRKRLVERIDDRGQSLDGAGEGGLCS